MGVVFAGCGIESYYYLYPPTNETSGTSSTTFVVQHNPQNNSSTFFTLGFDIYYRLYSGTGTDINSSPPNDAIQDMTAIASAAASSTTADNVVSTMTSHGFVKMDDSLKQSPQNMFIAIPTKNWSSNNVILTINISNSLSPAVATFSLSGTSLTPAASSGSVFRYTSGGNQPFSYFIADSQDCDASTGSSMNFPWIVIYAVEYGYAYQEIAEPYYSMPTCMNSLTSTGTYAPSYIGKY